MENGPFFERVRLLEVIIDYGSAFVTYGKEIESKGVQFPSRDAPDKINRGGQFAVARDSSNISAFLPQEHQIGMRSDERKYGQPDSLHILSNFFCIM